MEPLLVPKDHAPAAAATPGEHGGAASNESSTVVDTTSDPASAVGDTEQKTNDDESSGVEEKEDEEEEEIGDDAEADDMAARMGRRLAALPGKARESEPFTIFRVAGPMRDRYRHLYDPQMISLGPFHRGGGRHLAAMEEHKWRYLRDIVARPGGAPLATYARAARAMEARARRRYAEPVALSPAEFAEMLLLDGCFLIEFFLKGHESAEDALIDATWALQNVYNDMLLLENQLPFFVLERFYDLASGGLGRDHFLTDVLVNHLTVDMTASPRDPESTRPPDGEIHHLLHLYYHWFLPAEDRVGSGTSKSDNEAMEELISDSVDERTPWKLPPATELQDSGVTFRAKKSPRSMVEVTFDRRGGVLEIPAVESYTNHAIFANLLAYEQSRGRWELQRLVSYVLLMASVVDARRDVEALQRAGVFVRGDEETAAFYAHLGELCPPPEFVNNCYAILLRDVREYCGRSWNRHRAVLVHDYFSNPWTSMSAAAAVFLLILTVVQTIYTVLPYYSPN
jgi:hypothetical protein